MAHGDLQNIINQNIWKCLNNKILKSMNAEWWLSLPHMTLQCNLHVKFESGIPESYSPTSNYEKGA